MKYLQVFILYLLIIGLLGFIIHKTVDYLMTFEYWQHIALGYIGIAIIMTFLHYISSDKDES